MLGSMLGGGMFKLNNDLVVIDLEATAGTDAKGHQTNDFIIDIGAVLLNKEMKEISRFSSLVKPGEPISEFIEKLTGISDKMVQDESDWSVVGKDFENWVRENSGNPKKARLAAWGNYFDINLLRKAYRHYELDYPFSGTALDVKTIAFTWLALTGRRTDKINLEILAGILGIKPQGEYHRALTDAVVTAAILQKLWEELQGVFIPGKPGEPYQTYRLEPSN